MQDTEYAAGEMLDAWRERAIELAQEKHIVGTAFVLGTYTNAAGHVTTWRVPNEARTGYYSVDVQEDAGLGLPRCHCMAGENKRPCKHAGAVLWALAQRERATSPRGAAQSQRYHELES